MFQIRFKGIAYLAKSWFQFLEICVDPLKIPLRKEQTGGPGFVLYYAFSVGISLQQLSLSARFPPALISSFGPALGT